MVRLERFGGATGIVAVAAIATQFALVGTAGTDAQSLLRARARWELATFMRVVGVVGLTTSWPISRPWPCWRPSRCV